MTAAIDQFPESLSDADLPETPHQVPLDRAVIDDLVNRVRAGKRVDLLESLLDALDWSAFATTAGESLDEPGRDELRRYYREKWRDVGPLFLAELMSTEFMTEQRARGDVVFSDRLVQLGRSEPDLWHEIRQFFRRKEMVTALLAAAHDPNASVRALSVDDDEEDLWE